MIVFNLFGGNFINPRPFPQGMVRELTAENFNSETSGSIPIIVDFWAAWCGPCKMLAPVFEELSSEPAYRGKLRFAKLDTEKYPEIASGQDISGIPCLVMFRNGKEIDRIIGFAPKPLLKQKIDAVLGKA